MQASRFTGKESEMEKTYDVVITKYGTVEVKAENIERASEIAAGIDEANIKWETTEVSNVEEREMTLAEQLNEVLEILDTYNYDKRNWSLSQTERLLKNDPDVAVIWLIKIISEMQNEVNSCYKQINDKVTEEMGSKMTLYQVIHTYDVDGGFGDAVYQRDIIATFSSREKAEEFVAKYQKPHIYAKPYSYLSCGTLIIEENKINVEPSRGAMWWLDTDELIEDEDE